MEPQSQLQSLLPWASGVIGLAGALIGSFITHALSSVRDRRNEHRKQRTSILVDALSHLLKASNSPPDVAMPNIREASSRIQALGTRKQIEMLHRFINDLKANQDADLNPLMHDLRDHLRKELGAEPVDLPLMWVALFKPGDPLPKRS